MAKIYLAIDIGCIECGENSHFLGAFTSREIAEKMNKECRALQSQNWHGQHSFEIFELELDGVDKFVIPASNYGF